MHDFIYYHIMVTDVAKEQTAKLRIPVEMATHKLLRFSAALELLVIRRPGLMPLAFYRIDLARLLGANLQSGLQPWLRSSMRLSSSGYVTRPLSQLRNRSRGTLHRILRYRLGGFRGRGDRLRRSGNIAVSCLNAGNIGKRSGPGGSGCDLPGRRQGLRDIVLPALHFADIA